MRVLRRSRASGCSCSSRLDDPVDQAVGHPLLHVLTVLDWDPALARLRRAGDLVGA